jgi:hypothetical protein
MLQRLNFSLGEVPIDGDGIWTRARLEEMDAAFTGAVLRAFELKLESRSAAAATVSFRNGKTAAIESAIEAAWDLLCSREGEILFGEIVSFVRARCSSVDVLRIRFGIEQRLRERGAGW